MQLSEFHPYVMPYAMGCPVPTMEHHVRLAAIDFCRRTGVMVKALDAVQTDGLSNEVSPLPDAGLQIVRLLSVSVDGVQFRSVSATHGLDLLDNDNTGEFAFTRDNATVFINPLQISGLDVDVEAMLAPSLSATALPDELLAYVPDIAHGAIASLLMVPGQDFTNPDYAARSLDTFLKRAGTVAAMSSRGRTTAKMRSFATFL